jgi:hypothetical protein
LGYDSRDDIFARYVLFCERFTNSLACDLIAAK